MARARLLARPAARRTSTTKAEDARASRVALGWAAVSTSTQGVLARLRVQVRRLQFMVGLGLLSLVLGSMLSVALALRLGVRVQALPFNVLRVLVGVALENLWALTVLPLLCYGAARILELRPLPTALGSVLAGQSFLLVIEFTRDGFAGLLAGSWVVKALSLGALAGGVVLSRRAIERGRAAARGQEEAARAQAAARQDEYAEFLQVAERDGEKLAQREKEPKAPAA